MNIFRIIGDINYTARYKVLKNNNKNSKLGIRSKKRKTVKTHGSANESVPRYCVVCS